MAANTAARKPEIYYRWKPNFMLLTQFTNQFRFFPRSYAPCIFHRFHRTDFLAIFFCLPHDFAVKNGGFCRLRLPYWLAEQMPPDDEVRAHKSNLLELLQQIELVWYSSSVRTTASVCADNVCILWARIIRSFFFINYGSRCHGIMKNDREKRFFSLSAILRCTNVLRCPPVFFPSCENWRWTRCVVPQIFQKSVAAVVVASCCVRTTTVYLWPTLICSIVRTVRKQRPQHVHRICSFSITCMQ